MTTITMHVRHDIDLNTVEMASTRRPFVDLNDVEVSEIIMLQHVTENDVNYYFAGTQEVYAIIEEADFTNMLLGNVWYDYTTTFSTEEPVRNANLTVKLYGNGEVENFITIERLTRLDKDVQLTEEDSWGDYTYRDNCTQMKTFRVINVNGEVFVDVNGLSQAPLDSTVKGTLSLHTSNVGSMVPRELL